MTKKNSADPLYLHCSRMQACTTWLGALLNIIVFLSCAYWVYAHVDMAPSWPIWLISLIVSLFLLDFFSGVVHWATDTWFNEVQWERIVSIAREHHIYPYHIVGYSVRDYLGYSGWPSALVFGPIILATMLLAEISEAQLIVITISGIISGGMLFGTYAHRLAHTRSKNSAIKLMQRTHLLITPSHHAVHHRGNHDIRYCVINGWANYVCDKMGVWRGLEWLVQRITGAVPRENDKQWFRRFEEDPSFMEDPPATQEHPKK